jgi:hypothetical protein
MNTNEIILIVGIGVLFAIFLLYIGLKGAHQEPPAVIQKPKVQKQAFKQSNVEEEPLKQTKPKRKYYRKSSPRKPK